MKTFLSIALALALPYALVAQQIVQDQGQVGPTVNQDGAKQYFRITKDGSLANAEAHARYQEAVYRGAVFTVASQSAVSLGAGLSATSVWTLYNPATSKVNLVLWEASFAASAMPAASTTVWLTGPGTSGQAAPTGLTLDATPWTNALWGTSFSSSSARVYTAATLAAAPIVNRVLGSILLVGTAPTGVWFTPPTLGGELAGMIVIPPGAHVTVQASTAVSGYISMTWEEIPL